MKKAVVIPFEQYTKLQDNSQSIPQPIPETLLDPRVEQVRNIEKELAEILTSKVNVDEKRLKYQEILQKLLEVKDKYTGMHPFSNEVSQRDYERKDFKKVLENSLPPTLKNKGNALYDTLKDQLNWNELGQIVVNDQPLQGSNIVDLVSDLARDWKKKPIPGWDVIKRELQGVNFPRSLIHNKQRLQDWDNQSSVSEPVVPNERPYKGILHRKSKTISSPQVIRKKRNELARNWLRM